MDPFALESRLGSLSERVKLPRIVIPVHFSGRSCDMLSIAAQCRNHGITVIEDACHAIGGSYDNGRIGSCRHSDMTVFSFHPVKVITTGEGGMITTNSRDLYQRLLRLRTHGITRDVQFMTGASEGPWYYEQIDLGFNYRITDFQAALGTSQLKRIDDFVDRRRALANRYSEGLAGLPLVLPSCAPDDGSAWHLYVVRLQTGESRRSRREVFDALRMKGIGVNVHYIPVHLQPFYRRLGFRPSDFPEAERYYSEAITLPLFPGLTAEDQDFVIASVRELLS